MNSGYRGWILAGAIVMAAGLLCLVSLHGVPGSEKPLPRIRVDASPLEREGPSFTSFAPAIREAMPSVVHVYTRRKSPVVPMRQQIPFGGYGHLDPFDMIPNGPRGLPRIPEVRGSGSGVIVSDDGYILTNHHVIENADRIEIRYSNEDRVIPATLVGTDPSTEIAVIKVEAEGLSAITLGDSDNLEMGDLVLAIGNPFGIGKTVTMGIVSATGRGLATPREHHRIDNYIQTDAAINPGNSGGALVDAAGRLVGINTAIISRGGGNDGIGLAVPVNIARNVMEELVQHGEVRRGHLGISFQPLTKDLAGGFGLDEAQGVLVAEVFENSPADEAGLREGDVILEIDGRPVKNQFGFRSHIATSPGSTVNLLIHRDGKPMEMEVELGILHNEDFVSGSPWWNDDAMTVPSSALGMRLTDLEDDHPLEHGVRVEAVEPGSRAMRAGIREGDVIQSIGRQRIDNVRQALRLFRENPSQGVLVKVRRNGRTAFKMIN